MEIFQILHLLVDEEHLLTFTHDMIATSVVAYNTYSLNVIAIVIIFI